MKQIIYSFLIVVAISLPFSQSWAQATANSSNNSAGMGTAQTIFVSGMLGGIFGLSTLSFYKHPEDHILNIPIGAAVGMVGAIIYVSYRGISTVSVDEPILIVNPDPVKENISVGFAKAF